MRDIVLIAIVAGFSCVALYRPFVGVLFFAWLGFFNPQSYTWSIAHTLPFSQIAGGATIVGWLISRENKKIPYNREMVLLLASWAMFGVSSLFAIHGDAAVTDFISISKIFLMVVLTVTLTNDKTKLHMLTRVIALSIGFIGFKGGVFVFVSGGSFLVYGPEGSFLEANNAIGLALVMNIPLLHYLLNIEARPWMKWLLKAMLWLSYPAVICTYSRGAWLGLAMVTAIIFMRMKNKFVMVPLLGVLAMIGALVLPIVMPQRLSQRYDELVNYDKEESAESRFWSWEYCRRVGFARPVTGGGFKFNSIETYRQYYPEFLTRFPGKAWTCHSAWFTVFGEHGFPGFALWLGLLICCLLTLRQLRASGRRRAESAWLVPFADALQAGFVAFMVVSTFFDAAYFDMLYYLVAMVIIAKTIEQAGGQPGISHASIGKPMQAAGLAVP